MSQAAMSGTGAGDRPSLTNHPLVIRVLTIVTMAGLLAFIVHGVQTLWSEYAVLQGEISQARLRAVVGYPGIHPTPSFAQRPDEWLRDEGDHALLWAGWRDGVGHSWFRIGPGEVDADQLSPPVGRDFTRPIDRAIVEVGGGEIWGRIPDEALVVGETLGGVETAYPTVVLGKVTIVNDLIGDRPFLVTYEYRPQQGERVQIYEPTVKGRRLTLGPAGCHHDGRPVFYDRGSESLWVGDGEVLRSIAGVHKGSTMKRVANLAPVTWSQWRAEHPHGRLVIGADRNVPRPAL